jgi:hypothetical protein
VQGVCSCNAWMNCPRRKRIPTSAVMRVERVESSVVKKRKWRALCPAVRRICGPAHTRCNADATEKQTCYRGRHAHAVEADHGGTRADLAMGCCINFIQPIDESRCIRAVLSAGAEVDGHAQRAAARGHHRPRVTDERLQQLLPSREHQAEPAPNRGQAVVAGLAISSRRDDQ